jgi:hypothetical protein
MDLMITLRTLRVFYQKGGPLFLREMEKLLRMRYKTSMRWQSTWHARRRGLLVRQITQTRVLLLAIWVLENLSGRRRRRRAASPRMRRCDGLTLENLWELLRAIRRQLGSRWLWKPRAWW